MRHHIRHPQAMFNKGSLFYSHCGFTTTAGNICMVCSSYERNGFAQRAIAKQSDH
jgi:hypothetical protein